MLTDSERFAFIARRHHAFETTGNAYDAVQTDETIRTGDTLVVLAERVVGIAITWPFAVTAEAGKLHAVKTPEPGEPLARIASELGVTEADMDYAIALATAFGFPLDESLAAYVKTARPAGD